MSLSKKQSEFKDRALKGDNIFLTGKAGTGKTYIVKEVINILREIGKNVVALAPTGVAANNIGGQTIHSMFNINPYGVMTFEECNFLKQEKRRLLDRVDVIVFDEVSMLRPDVLDALEWTLRKNKCRRLTEKQIIFVGDLKQLRAPMDDNTRSILRKEYEGDEFYYSKIFHSLNIEEINLDEILRQSDKEFIEALNVIREGGKSQYFKKFSNLPQKGIVLAPHNSTVQAYNDEGLRKINSKEIILTAHIEGNAKASDFALESKIYVKNGARIMYLINSKENNLVNGTLGIFRIIEGKYFIDVNGVDYALEKTTIVKKQYVLNEEKNVIEMQEIGSITQYPFKLAYALTIHKSQGLTFEELTIDLTKSCFEPGQMYTALSRITGPNGLSIIH